MRYQIDWSWNLSVDKYETVTSNRHNFVNE